MTKSLLNAFFNMRKCERGAILVSMSYNMNKQIGETMIDFCERVCRQVCRDGRVREFEEAIRQYD